MRLLWRHRIATFSLAIAASVILTLWTTNREQKTQLLYTLTVNGAVTPPANLFKMITDYPDIRAHQDDEDGDGLKWRVNNRRASVLIPGVTSGNAMQYKKVMDSALQNALQRLNIYSLDVVETSELSRSESTGNADEFSRDVLKAKLFNRYFENDQKMIAYFNIDVKDGLVLPAWLLFMLYLPLCFMGAAFGLMNCALWRSAMPQVIAFFRTEIVNERS